MKLLILIFSLSTFAQQPALENKCSTYKKFPDKYTETAKERCESYLYYYGLSGKEGDEEAKKCAYRELAEDEGLVFGGPSILMMIYANGRGVKKDIDLALKYACLLSGSETEMEERIDHLNRLRNKNEKFDVCDDITSGFMAGHCTRLKTQKSKEERALRIETLKKTLNVTEQAAFTSLQEAFKQFKKERTSKEVDLSGSARAQLVLEEEEALEKDFLGKLERFEKGKYPVSGKDNDAALNSVYKAIISKEVGMGTQTAKGHKETQRAWLKYRDAWLRYATIRYPIIDKTSLQRELTADRISQLEELR